MFTDVRARILLDIIVTILQKIDDQQKEQQRLD